MSTPIAGEIGEQPDRRVSRADVEELALGRQRVASEPRERSRVRAVREGASRRRSRRRRRCSCRPRSRRRAGSSGAAPPARASATARAAYTWSAPAQRAWSTSPATVKRAGRAGERVAHLDRVADVHGPAGKAALEIGPQVGADDHLGGIARDRARTASRADPCATGGEPCPTKEPSKPTTVTGTGAVDAPSWSCASMALVAVDARDAGQLRHVAYRHRPRRIRRDLERGRAAEPAGNRVDVVAVELADRHEQRQREDRHRVHRHDERGPARRGPRVRETDPERQPLGARAAPTTGG